MFGELFLKECKQLLKSFMYYLIMVFLVVFYVSQMGEITSINKPIPGSESYGEKYSGDMSHVMKSAVNQLIREHEGNLYVTYPIGVYKEVTLSEEDKVKVEEIIESLTGFDKSKIHNMVMDEDIVVKQGITENVFMESMKKVDEILGGGSKYDENNLKHNAMIPKTYEDAMKEYEDIIEKDKVSGAYARLFCDYMGIILAILPVFLAVARGMKDRKNQVDDVVFSKKISSCKIVGSRYLAIVVMIIIPVILLSILPTLQSMYIANSNGVSADIFAFLRYSIGWLLPTIMFTVALGLFITELTGGVLGVLVQGVIWFGSILCGTGNLVGYVGMNLIPRFNTVGESEVYRKIFNDLILNRMCYAALAMVLVAGTVLIYNLRRKGKLNIYGKIPKHIKSKSEV